MIVKAINSKKVFITGQVSKPGAYQLADGMTAIQLIAMAGAFIPFPATRAERERTRDPRQSITERYGTRADYVKKIQESALRLAQERYILKDDAPTIVQEAGRHWDSLMTPTTRTSEGAR